MPQWERAQVDDLLCGGCSGTIRRGQPILVYVLPTRKKIRCQSCAGEPVPQNLSALQDQEPSFQPMVKAAVIVLPFDYKKRAGGDA